MNPKIPEPCKRTDAHLSPSLQRPRKFQEGFSLGRDTTADYRKPFILLSVLLSSNLFDVALQGIKMATITNSEVKNLKSSPHRVLALYKFVETKFEQDELNELRSQLQEKCQQYDARGTLLLAREGINGTICYPFEGVSDDPMLTFLQSKFGDDLRIRISDSHFNCFPRMKVKVKGEIVSIHDGECDPTEGKGEYIKPEDWNDLLNDPDCLVIDTRNDYEVHVGTFRNAVNPQTKGFTDFPKWMEENLVGASLPKKIAMFCTGGIRCEKATNVCQKLVPDDVSVYHLEGGILAYLDSVKPEDSMFEGDCYVFDQRVAVTYGNKPSTRYVDSCKACRHPLSEEELKGEKYIEGLSCVWCYDTLTDKQKDRFTMRQRQVEIARERGVEEFFNPEQMRKRKQELRST